MLRVLQSGIYASIQDLGRFQFRSYGVPVSGAMDQYAARLVNLLLGNGENDAVLEVTLSGSFQFTKDTLICITGADLDAHLNQRKIQYNHPIKVSQNDILTFKEPIYGVRAYVGIKDGFLNKPVLGSRSLFKEITMKPRLQKGDEIFYEPSHSSEPLAYSHIKVDQDRFKSSELEVFKGPEFDLLDSNQQRQLIDQKFSISADHNRMGYKLNELVSNKLDSILTAAVMPGTVQLTPSGKILILMRDCGVTGGYPRVLQLTEDAVNLLAQKTTNDVFSFKLIDLPL